MGQGRGEPGARLSLPPAIAAEIDAIRRDNLTGAMGLVRRAAEAFRRLAADLTTAETVALAAGALQCAQPAMAPMHHLAERLRHAQPAAVARVCAEFLKQLETADAAIAGHALGLMPDQATVLTHSYSGTVATVFEAAHKAGKLGRVIATESRPIQEGISLAHRLAERGIPVDLIIDAAIAHVMSEAQLVLVGADALSAHGLVNKTGTHLAALAAREHRVPFYVAASSLKIAPPDYTPAPEPPRPTREIAADEIVGCRIRNYYFDTTPLDLVTAVVTESGIIRDYRGL